jgi:tyrosyl-tRNA synthetase
MFPSLNEQMDIIRAGANEVLPEAELEQKIARSIKENKPMTVKLGCDPSRPDLHIGHGVVLHKLRQFQDLGHRATLIVGDFTAMIGDPTGKSKTRPPLTIEETRENGRTYLEQAAKLLSSDKLDVKFNSEWLGTMNFMDVIKMAANYTVAQLLERDDFSKRFKGNTPISLHEFLYPLAQAYDSVFIKSDIELGGNDQKFNLLVGRELQRSYGVEPQCILTMPILEGTDGVEKMSKSLNNYIAFTDTPRDIFGKTMSIPDELISRYYQFGAFAPLADVKAMSEGLKDGSYHPRDAKVKTAMSIVEVYYDKDAAQGAFDEFERMFKKKDIPDDIDTFTLPEQEMTIVDAVALAGMTPSKKEAKKMIEQGGIYLDGERVEDMHLRVDFSEQRLVKVGKRKFLYMISK